ncbi:hypothetical protein HOY82DRAFT_601057 [Tuber indicum]|nr:hypothetical protein HOY82DRAFT_601057 [Tuber indicum]
MEKVAEEKVEEVVQVAPMDMELTEEERVNEVQKVQVVACENKKKKVNEVVVAPLGSKAWGVGKGMVDTYSSI